MKKFVFPILLALCFTSASFAGEQTRPKACRARAQDRVIKKIVSDNNSTSKEAPPVAASVAVPAK